MQWQTCCSSELFIALSLQGRAAVTSQPVGLPVGVCCVSVVEEGTFIGNHGRQDVVVVFLLLFLLLIKVNL